LSTILAKNPPNRAAGTSLLEVLVTVVLLSIGLLGIAGTQTVGLKNVANATLRTQASVLAYDILDRMRANAANANNYNITIDAAAPTSPATVAQQDLAGWLSSLASNLPQGDGAVVVGTVAGAVTVTVTVQWTEREGNSGVAHTFDITTRL
jgi:type IV pilus assembly protein PilV